jgi:branched-chain amino acid aminotransferase
VGTKSDLVITAYTQNKKMPEPITLGVSTWQRSNDISLPARIKTSTNYQVGRLARIEGRHRNFDDMVLLNNVGRVAETTGSCILIVRDDAIITPPASEGALESITLDIAEKLAVSYGYEFYRRPIDRTELVVADEITICGTLSELVPVKGIDDITVNPNGPIFSNLRKAFFDIVRGRQHSPAIELEFLPEDYITAKR